MISDAEGAPKYIVAVGRDITERKRAEKAQSESEEQYRSVVDNANVGIVVIQKGKQVFCNARVPEILGYSEEEYQHLDFVTTIHPDDRELTIERIRKRARNEDIGAEGLEIRLITKSGEARWVQANSSFIHWEGEPAIQAFIVDITERKQTENLIRTQRDLALTLNNTSDLETGLRLCLEAAIRLSGLDGGGVYLVDEVSGAVDLVVHQGMLPEFVASASHYETDSANAQIVKAGQPVYTEYVQLGVPLDEAEQRESLQAIAVIPIHHEDRVISCLNVASHTMAEVPTFARDVLETIAAQIGGSIARLQSEEELRKAKERAELIYRVVPSAIFTVDENRVITSINDKALAVLGYAAEEIIGKPCTTFATQPCTEMCGLFVDGVSGPLRSRECVIRTKSGEQRIVIKNTEPLRDADGKVVGGIESFEDITERQRVEEALIESEEKFSRVFRASPLAVVVTQLSDGRFIEVNQTFETFTGYHRNEVIGHTSLELGLVNPKERTKHWHILQEHSSYKNTEVQFYTKSGEERIGLFSGDIIEIGGEACIIQVVSDITDRKLAEEELARHRENLEELVKERTGELKAANEQLLALSQVKDEFITNVSHEFRTPLASLKVHHHLLTANPKKLSVYLQRLQRDTNRLEHLVENLLFISRLDQDGVEINLAVVDLAEMAKMYVDDRVSLAQERELTLVCANEPAVPPAKADPVLLEQALGALLTNALNYTPNGGKIEVRARSQRDDAQYWVGLSVNDTGPGIQSDEIPHITERFFRGQAARQSSRPGTGLGLAIVKEIMDRHQGRIEIESEGVPGKGATFTLWLPANDDSAT
jgi:PAS domain S-box-containing protein